MHWLQSLDVELFRWINLKLINPVFDVLMPWASGNPWFFPVLVLAGILLVCKGGARGRMCALMLALIIPFCDGFVCNNLKHAVGRLRPFDALSEVHRPGSASTPAGEAPLASSPRSYSANSMPSSHAANWFAATMVALVYYRRSLWFMLPAALLVSFSRIYNGVHYPSDVLAGALLGAGCAAAALWWLNAVWQWAGSKWFPLWWTKMPSLTVPLVRGETEDEEPARPPPRGAESATQAPHASLDVHWLRLGWLLIVGLLLCRLAYLASGTIQLSKDEAYQWLWSKHLALSYYSKPPLIAYTQFLGTSLWGDTEFGVRFFSPIIAALLGFLVLRFFAREINARAGFFLLLILAAMPLASLGAVLMTVDPLSVFFWTAAMLAGWKAVQEQATWRDWALTGLWMGLGFLSKYTELFQLLCWIVFFALWPPARKHLRRPGPCLALLINLVCALPVLLWNAQRHWITIAHVANDAGRGSGWPWPPFKYAGEFLGVEALLLNPIFFAGMIWAAIAFWRRGRHNPRLVYFFSMGAPLFLAYLLWSFHSRIFPNWIAPSVLPLLCLMVAYWDTRWRLGAPKIKPWLTAGLLAGFAVVIVAHNTDLWRFTLPWRLQIAALLPSGRADHTAGLAEEHLPANSDPVQPPGLTAWKAVLREKYLPVNLDPLHRVRAWSDAARAAGEARQKLLAEGKPVFIITDDYQLAGELSFYLPEAKAGVPDHPLVYFKTSPTAVNQFFFWPGYLGRKGENAIFIREIDRSGRPPGPEPALLKTEFDSVTELGVSNILYHGQLCWPLQIFACRGLR